MSSNQQLGQAADQLVFQPFKSLLQSISKKRPNKATKGLGLLGQNSLVKPFRFPAFPYEYKVVPLRECIPPDGMQLCDTPERAVDYWRSNIESHPYYNPECECCAVILVNARRRVKGHQLVSTGTMDTLLVHPREVFRLAVITSAAAIILAHNHPSGESDPSEADIKVTRDLIRAGQLMKIDVLDHIVIGNKTHSSLRDLGYFYS